MFKKFYEKTKRYIIKNHNFLLFLVLLFIVLNIKTPYIINAPGGTMSLSDRVYINGKKIKSNYHTTYVKVIEGKVAGVIASYIFPNWDLEKYEEYNGDTDLSYEEFNKVEKLMMEDGNNQAIKTALEKAGVDYKIINSRLVVSYKHSEYKNNLKIGDVIKTCDSKTIESLDELHECVINSDDEVRLTVLRNGKNKEVTAKTHAYENEKIIGISVINLFDIESKYDIKIKTSSSESGSSGGFMTTLSIYSEIANLNIPKDIKIAGTGTIEEKEKIGRIEGIKYKLLGSEKENVDIFFVPKDNYDEAIKVKKKYKLKMKLVEVEKLDDAINYLNNIKR